jgi:hypothetical protein
LPDRLHETTEIRSVAAAQWSNLIFMSLRACAEPFHPTQSWLLSSAHGSKS